MKKKQSYEPESAWNRFQRTENVVRRIKMQTSFSLRALRSLIKSIKDKFFNINTFCNIFLFWFWKDLDSTWTRVYVIWICTTDFNMDTGSVPDKFWFGSGSSDPYVSLTNGSGSGSCSFRQWPSRRQQKIIIFPSLFMLIPFWSYRTFTSFFKAKKS